MPLLHLQDAIKSRKSAATRVARYVKRDRGYPQSCATKFGRVPGDLWIAVKFHSERTSREVSGELPGKFGDFHKLGGA